ncbi:AT-rich interactive domain-containing protein 4B isoform X1 [Corvus cornix cornix]|uniref:AT-rich interactive domain-containing protein 4B isoform X1 n=1 Tax=Corvus moneduloides TaxID=1196302 RepID=UPI0009AD2437|nr:AT-rich interactive domain-containing protein 4B isoform X1 [Corvus moneduloides]XP_031958162.1 AT-rich interactive domain-containing protein 4B isoform X1 [Corvus moneduloides]XP_031958164.1 AT-rich interactive domain-containing protein 4B isoform X1 [Corvus moneduloides]XP_039424074.1 AT-rich interactive domain-containing protein 4B isoform X1 [Corvus cornix cornix]XP_039424075.1 AT-rich interactive domain-containing protein 4B isoform X1 [Corvus cornix cornix]XP_039424076.1 AT-rich inter
MKAIDEPPYLTVGTDVSAKYRGAFCEAKIKTAKRLVKVKVTFRHDSSTVEVQDDHIKGPLKVGTVVEVKNPDGTYQEAVINKLTDASWYTVVFDDGDEKTLRRSSLCLKGERHFAESETLDQLPLTNPEHFGTPVIGKKTNRGRRSNHIPEEESSSSSSDEDEDDRKQSDELLGKVVCVDCFSVDKKKALWFPALVVCPDCSDDIAVKKDNILVRSFKDGKFVSVPRKDVREISETSPKPDALLKQAFDQALEFRKNRTVPSNWKTELKEDSSSSEAEEEEEDEKEKEDNSSEEEEEIEPFPEERENFLQQLYKFMEDRGTPINKRPVLGYRNLNLFKLFRLVHKLGGFDNIESGAVWKQVYQDLGIPVLNSAAGYNVKCAYRKYLYGFEEYCTSANIEFQMALPEKVTNKPCKDCEKEKELKMREEPEQDAKEIKVDKDERKQEEVAVVQQEEKKLAENDNESKENDKPSVLGNKKNLPDSVFTQPDQEKDLNVIKTEDETKLEDKEEEKIKEMENPTVNVDAEEKEKSGYDEWIKADKIVRPADKNVPKIKHRKKIKNKTDREKEEKYSPKPCKLRRLSKPPFHTSTSPETGSKLDSTEAKNTEQAPVKSIEITSIINGLQASESSDDSEQEDDQSALNVHADGKEESQPEAVSQDKNELRLKEQSGSSLPEETKALTDAVVPKSVSKSPERLRKEMEELSEDSDSDGEDEATKKRKDGKKEIVDKTAKPQVKRGKRRHCVAEESLKTVSPNRKDEKSKNKDSLSLENSSNSSSDEDEEDKSKLKITTKKYNGLEEKRKSLRTSTFYSGFSEVGEKRIKLLNNSDERLQNTRAKDRKDVWSSIQGQWPKKTLKELFSDSDTEAAASPPHAAPEDAAAEEQLQTLTEEGISLPNCELEKSLPASVDVKPVEEKPTEVGEKKVEFPSSGSNSVLNTPPTTPESPSSVTVTESSRHQSSVTVSETLPPNQEEIRSIKSETDSTIEVDSVAGELQDLQSEGNISPTGFDASVSSSSSNQPEPEHAEKVCTGQKRLKDAQGGGSSSKKQKRSHKTSVNSKKKSKPTNSSDSDELSAGESVSKSQSAKSVSTGMKSHQTKSLTRTQSPGKCGKNGEKESDLKEQNNRLPKVYKWSFQMSDLENLTSAERITVLQEKLQEIRKHYLSLKSEVASIDRRRKRLKKKERESAATTSSSSSSPSSSSITAAVMLTLAEPSMSSSSQNGMSVECR